MKSDYVEDLELKDSRMVDLEFKLNIITDYRIIGI